MSLLENKLWVKDIDMVIESLPEIERLNNKKIFITGSTGLICSAIIDVLIRYNEVHNGDIIIYAAGRNGEKVRQRFAKVFAKDYFHYISYNAINDRIELDYMMDYIIHGASNSSPNKYVNDPVNTIMANFNGIRALLDVIKRQEGGRLLYISSSEVYGRKNNSSPFNEEEYGYIDILNPRNSYSMGKRAAEALCAAYTQESNIDTVIVRPGHIYGPTAAENDTRVASAWAYDVIHGKNIVMKSDGSQLRSYCYCLDCASAIIKVLLCGKSANAYNISNPESIISIKDMATLLCKYANVKLLNEKPNEEDKKTFNPMMNSSLDSVKLQNLGWKGVFNAKTGFSHTVSILSEEVETTHI